MKVEGNAKSMSMCPSPTARSTGHSSESDLGCQCDNRHLQDSPSVPFRFLNPDIPTLKDEEIKISKQ
jgi:hypothetical protein